MCSILKYKMSEPVNNIHINTVFAEIENLLHEACRNSQTDIVQLLMDHGADVSIMTNDGITPLDLARINRDIETIELLKNYL